MKIKVKIVLISMLLFISTLFGIKAYAVINDNIIDNNKETKINNLDNITADFKVNKLLANQATINPYNIVPTTLQCDEEVIHSKWYTEADISEYPPATVEFCPSTGVLNVSDGYLYRLNNRTTVNDSAIDNKPILISNIKIINFLEGVKAPEESHDLLEHNIFKNVEKISGDLDTSKVLYMSYMFSGSKADLSHLNINDWDTSNVTEMAGMFNNATLPENLDLSGWDTSSVHSMYNMFRYTELPENIGLASWDTHNVNRIYEMFYNATLPENLDLSGWNTDYISDNSAMFFGIKGSKNLNLSGWNVSNVKDISSMFAKGTIQDTLDLSDWNTSGIKYMDYMFTSTSIGEIKGLADFNTSNVVSMPGMFNGAILPETLDLSTWNTSKVSEMNGMFQHVRNIKSLNLSTWNTSKVTEMQNMFNGESGSVSVDSPLEILDISNFQFNSNIDMTGMFNNTGNLKFIKLGVNTKFKSNTSLPNINTNDQYTGRWIKNENSDSYKPIIPIITFENSIDFMNDYDGTNPGWYTWEKGANISAVPVIKAANGEVYSIKMII